MLPLVSQRWFLSVVVLGGIAALLLACEDPARNGTASPPTPGGNKPTVPQAASRFPTLWDRAVRAHGGAEALGRIRSLRAASRAIEPGQPAKRVVSTAVFPDRLRFEETALDAQLVLALDGTSAWKTLDGVRLELEEDEERDLRNEMLAIRLALFVSLDPERDVDVKVDGSDDGLDWLEVEFLQGAAPPYRLGFDAESHLLRRAEWSARLHGRGAAKKLVRMDLSDYRAVDGVMVSFAATYTVEGEILGRNEVDQVEFNPTLAEGVFAAPPPEPVPPILRRMTEERRVALLAGEGGRTASSEDLEKAASDLGLSRRGPIFQLVRDAVAGSTVGMAVSESPERPITALPPGLTLEDLPATPALTVVVAKADSAAFAAAHARLMERARADGLIPVDTFRHVMWNKDVWQVQLPVRAP